MPGEPESLADWQSDHRVAIRRCSLRYLPALVLWCAMKNMSTFFISHFTRRTRKMCDLKNTTDVAEKRAIKKDALLNNYTATYSQSHYFSWTAFFNYWFP